MPANDLTLYAKWMVNQYTITFETNGGSTVPSITLNFGELVTAPADPTREGYIFNGWYVDANLTQVYGFSTIPANDFTLYANWTINQYTITFETNGGSIIQAQTYYFAINLSLPTPVRSGYSFTGWYLDTEFTEPFTLNTMPASNIKLYAKWTVNEPGAFTLRVWGPSQEQLYLQDVIASFKLLYPSITINFETAVVGEPDLKSLLLLDVPGGADVFAFPDDQLEDLVAAGAISEVTQYKADVTARNVPWTLEVSTVGDKLYAYPSTADNTSFMYYDSRFITAEEMGSLDTILAKAASKACHQVYLT
jgi:uncharacterized repeat protein (TIGR02543 family)